MSFCYPGLHHATPQSIKPDPLFSGGREMDWLDRLHRSVYVPVDSSMVDLHSQKIGVIHIDGAELQSLEGTKNEF